MCLPIPLHSSEWTTRGRQQPCIKTCSAGRLRDQLIPTGSQKLIITATPVRTSRLFWLGSLRRGQLQIRRIGRLHSPSFFFLPWVLNSLNAQRSVHSTRKRMVLLYRSDSCEFFLFKRSSLYSDSILGFLGLIRALSANTPPREIVP